MKIRAKVFTFISGHGETVVEASHEDRINEWLGRIKGEIVELTQSESARPNGGNHVTVCVWYLPNHSED